MNDENNEVLAGTSQGRAETFKKKIEASSKVNFGISSCPLPLFERFKELAAKDFSDTYHLALRYMVDLYEGRKETDALWDVIHRLHSRVEAVELSLGELSEAPVDEDLTVSAKEEFERTVKTFGKKGQEDD